MSTRSIFLYGELGRKYGKHFRINVSSPAEAIRALMTLRPGIRQDIRTRYWRVVVGKPHIKNSIDVSFLGMNLGNQDFHLVPATQPSGGGDGKSIGQIIVGVVLIGVAIVATGGIGAAFATPLFLGLSYGSLIVLGAGLILSGVAGLITPLPQLEKGQQATDQAQPTDRPSFLFNGVTNNSQQGGPVPLVFGTHLTGSVVISAGINAEDIAI